MDTNTINHVSLCSGYGGIDLGLKRAIGERLRTVAFVEVECFAVCNLAAKAEAKLLDNAPIWSDLRTFPWGKFHGLVDILSGGYPCQPFSAAGKRLGAEDPRHLWPHISTGIAAMRPSVCFFENVEGHISLGLPDVLQDLAGMGYRTTWCVASASECGAPHQRKRIFILAYDSSAGLQGHLSKLLNAKGWQEPRGSVGSSSGFGGANDLAHANGAGGWQDRQSSEPWTACTEQSSSDSWGSKPRQIREEQAWPSRPGEQQYEWEPPRVIVGNAASNGGKVGKALHTGDEWQRFDQGRDAMGHTGSQRCEQAECDVRGQQQASGSAEECGLGVAEAMGHPNGERPQERSRQRGSAIQGADTDGGKTAERQAEPSLGRDTNGLTHRLDDAFLHVSTDNRTDELRLLGNGVVPATAERAFRVLVGELMEEQL